MRILISNFYGDRDIYAELNLKEGKAGWKKSEPVDKVHIKYHPNNNITTYEYVLPNQIEKDVRSPESAVCVTK